MLLLFLYFSCKDNLNFPICQTNSCFFSFPHKNRVGGKPRPMRSQPPQNAAPGSGPKVDPAGLGSGAKVQSPATLLWGLTPASSLMLIRRSGPRVKIIARLVQNEKKFCQKG